MRELLPFGGHGLYDRLVARPLAAFYARLARRLPPGRVLDIGCGPGHLAAVLVADGRDVVAVDKDPRQVRIAKRNHPELDVREGDAEALEFPDGSFDVVVTSESFHHWRDTDAGAAEASRVLVPGGSFVVIEGCGDVTNGEVAAFMGRRPWPGLPAIARLVFRTHGYLPAGLQENVLPVLRRHFDHVEFVRVDGWWVVEATSSTAN
jgi:SAM-dependent methyltransferase